MLSASAASPLLSFTATQLDRPYGIIPILQKRNVNLRNFFNNAQRSQVLGQGCCYRERTETMTGCVSEHRGGGGGLAISDLIHTQEAVTQDLSRPPGSEP